MASSTVPSTAFTIQIAKASMVYGGRDIAKKAFRANPTNQNLPLQLEFAYKVLEWHYNYDPTNTYLKLMRNYTLMLCGQYIVEASQNIGSGGVIIVPSIAPIFNWKWVTKSFTVGAAGSPVLDGELSFTINEDNIAVDSAAFGFSNASPFPRTGTVPTGQQTYLPTYTQSSMTITMAAVVHDGEQYTLTYVRLGGTQAFSGGGTTLPNDAGHEGQILFTDGAGNYYWADAHIDYVSADFESDGITVIDTRLEHNTFDLFLESLNRDLISDGDNPEFTRIDGGGYVINLEGFNANTQDQRLRADLKGLNS